MGNELPNPFRTGSAQQTVDVCNGDFLSAEREQLLQERLAVAHRAGSPTGENFERLRLRLHAFTFGDEFQPFDDLRRLDPGEIEALAAGKDRDRNLFRLGRAENKLYMLRRLFKRLQ